MLEIVPDIAQSTHGNRNIFADIRNVPTRPHTVLGMFLLAFSVHLHFFVLELLLVLDHLFVLVREIILIFFLFYFCTLN
jgi:hypothetical protein